MTSLLPLVVLFLGIEDPCSTPDDLLFMFCMEYGHQTVCSKYPFPKSWDCDSIMGQQCTEDLLGLNAYCLENR